MISRYKQIKKHILNVFYFTCLEFRRNRLQTFHESGIHWARGSSMSYNGSEGLLGEYVEASVRDRGGWESPLMTTLKKGSYEIKIDKVLN